MTNILSVVAHRPYPLPADPWRMAQRWNDLLFAHWPIRPDAIARLLPPGLEVDRFDGDAWVGVVPFWMNKVRTRTAGEACITIPSAKTFSELNLRTYVRSRASGLRGVYFFSLDAVSALAVLGARLLFHLPYFLASMARQSETDGTLLYTSKRLLTARNPCFKARYRALGKVAQPAAQRTLEYFLTERYCLFTPNRGRLLVGHIHHLPWPLQPAEAEILVNEIPKAHRITLPDQPPVLHFAKQLEVYIWSLREDRQDRQFKSPITP
jgi:uncharacterized protein YqjF (DUF2071 family)